jgi:lysyl-tRNA synthetase class 2
LTEDYIWLTSYTAVTGFAREKKGQPLIESRELPRLVSPTMEQIPKTLTDPKTRMQDRHVDMLVNKNVVDVLRLRSEITKHMRDHLHSKRFLEFQTPILAENAGGAVARRFATRATELRGKNLALRVAPELWLKRLVIGGVDRVFEIGPAFRNEGVDATHNPEFTMCEFYSAYSNLEDLIKETEEIIHGLATRCQNLISTELTSLPSLDMSRYVRPFKQVEFIPSLEAAMGIRFPKLSSDDAFPEMLAVLKLAKINIPGGTPRSLAKLLDRLAAVYLEPMSAAEPIFITHHPAVMSPLAKSFLCPETYQMVSARAELFIGGREVANMYEEENDPEEQRRKMMAHRRLVNKSDGSVAMLEEAHDEYIEEDEGAHDDGRRLRPGEEAIDEEEDYVEEEEESEEDDDESPLDDGFVKALDYGLPPTGGWGCGMERLVMVFSGVNRISDCLSFGTLRNVVGLSSAEEEKKVLAKKQATSSSSRDEESKHEEVS